MKEETLMNVISDERLLTPWQDTFIIAEAIKENSLDEGILKAIQQQEEKADYIESEDEEESEKNEVKNTENKNKKTHAEMKIINRLYKKQQPVIDKYDNDKYRWDVYGTHGSSEHKEN
ncbi:3410_t:CDS:2 [Entrophospora sp. SA101]|nr:3410_t:CDS:2 [Entrophospora sp. SA101]